MEIEKVSIVGLGALGVLFGQQLAKNMPKAKLRIIADAERIKRYERDGVFSNHARCNFHYMRPEEQGDPADLILFAVKFDSLPGAIEAARNQIGPNTVILSLLNGIVSEEIIGREFGFEKMLYAVAQGMDSVKVGNQMTYQNMGMICFGSLENGAPMEKAEAIARFFDRTKLPYQVSSDMKKRLWGKFMLNVGVNQTAAVFGCGYGGILKDGEARETMIAAMREVMALSQREGVHLTQTDLEYWIHVLDKLNPEGRPSMQQDLEAKRHSEVALFSGTVLALGKKHGMTCPVNQMLYDRIQEIERGF